MNDVLIGSLFNVLLISSRKASDLCWEKLESIHCSVSIVRKLQYNEIKFVGVSKSRSRSGRTVLVDRMAIICKETEKCLYGTFIQLHRAADPLRGFPIFLYDFFSNLRTVHRGPADVGINCGV